MQHPVLQYSCRVRCWSWLHRPKARQPLRRVLRPRTRARLRITFIHGFKGQTLYEQMRANMGIGINLQNFEDDAVNFPAMWRNPGDGFETGCTDWGVENICIADGEGDHMFTLKGKVR